MKDITEIKSYIINLEKYKAKDSRIRIINQVNKGVSVARNNGLKIAKGKYIGFVDSDDCCDEMMLMMEYFYTGKIK